MKTQGKPGESCESLQRVTALRFDPRKEDKSQEITDGNMKSFSVFFLHHPCNSNFQDAGNCFRVKPLLTPTLSSKRDN